MAARREKMQISVKNLKDETTTVEVESSDTVGDLRAKLQQKPGIFLQSSIDGKQDVSFKFGSKIMDDDRITLGYYNIQQGSTVDVIMKVVRGGASGSGSGSSRSNVPIQSVSETMAARRRGMQIFVTNLMGETTIVEVQRSETVGNLRAKLQQKPGIFLQSSADGQQDVSFKHGPNIMDDDRITLGYYGIQPGSVVDVIMRVRGGASSGSSAGKKDEKVSEKKTILVYVYSPAKENYTRLEIDKDATVDHVKERVLREEGVDIPKEETQLSSMSCDNGRIIMEDGNRKLLDHDMWKAFIDLRLEWKVEGGEEEVEVEELKNEDEAKEEPGIEDEAEEEPRNEDEAEEELLNEEGFGENDVGDA